MIMALSLKWIRLGHATDATIKSLYIDTGTKSTDIFDIVLETGVGVLPAAERNRSGGIGYLHFKGMPRM